MKELSAFKRTNLLKCCDIGSRMTHFGLARVKLHSLTQTVWGPLELTVYKLIIGP
jgi:hypothetical protein